jgi:predicted Zn-dependent protease
VRAHGVSNEQYLAAAYNVKSGHFVQDMGNATRMLKRGMVGVAMHNTKGRANVAALVDRALAADSTRRAQADEGKGGEA